MYKSLVFIIAMLCYQVVIIAAPLEFKQEVVCVGEIDVGIVHIDSTSQESFNAALWHYLSLGITTSNFRVDKEHVYPLFVRCSIYKYSKPIVLTAYLKVSGTEVLSSCNNYKNITITSRYLKLSGTEI